MHRYNIVCMTPKRVIIIGYIFLIIFMFALYQMDFYYDSEYFRWGPPVFIFKKTISLHYEFYILLIFFFINKIINTLISEIVYTWIVNCIQDPKSKNTFYSKNTSLVIVLGNAMHLSMNSMFTINGSSAQVSFLVVDLIGNLLVIFYTNKKFIDRIHDEYENNHDDREHLIDYLHLDI